MKKINLTLIGIVFIISYSLSQHHNTDMSDTSLTYQKHMIYSHTPPPDTAKKYKIKKISVLENSYNHISKDTTFFEGRTADFIFDTNGRVIQSYEYRYDILIYAKYDYFYDKKGNCLKIIFKSIGEKEPYISYEYEECPCEPNTGCECRYPYPNIQSLSTTFHDKIDGKLYYYYYVPTYGITPSYRELIDFEEVKNTNEIYISPIISKRVRIHNKDGEFSVGVTTYEYDFFDD